MYFNTYTQGYFVSGNERINTERIVSTNVNNFPLIITFNAVNTGIEIVPPITFSLRIFNKMLVCDSPYVKILNWKETTFELFISQPISFIHPKPLNQLVIESKCNYLATLSCDSLTRLLIESDNDCQLFTLGSLVNPTMKQDTVSNICYVIITDDNKFLCVIEISESIKVVIQGYFHSHSLKPNVITVSELNDTLKHLVTNTYQYLPSGLKLLSKNAEPRLKASTQQIPVCLFEAIKVENLSEIISYLSDDYKQIRLNDLVNYFPRFDYAKVPTLISAPNTVALIDINSMTVHYAKIEMRGDKITNFDLI